MAHRQPLEDIVFISNFAAFCRTKGDEAYDCCDVSNCALAQFGFRSIDELDCGELGIPLAAYKAAATPGHNPQTFSALADRLEALIVDSPVVQVQA